MYSTRPGLILGFHGCDQTLVDQVVNGEKCLENSRNTWDWLGHGIYFWENSPARALDFARNNSKVKTPSVLGAVINLGYCLDLLDFGNNEILKSGYDLLKSTWNSSEFPQNISPPNSKHNKQDKVIRKLDCAVIESVHSIIKKSEKKGFDSIRGLFNEGNPLYEDAGFLDKNHIQICITNPNCIKGFFLPREFSNNHPKV